MSPLERLRRLTGTWLAARTERERARWRGESDASLADVRRARAALGTGEARASLEEARRLGLVDDLDLRAWLALLAMAAREEVLDRRRALEPLPASHEVQLEQERVRVAALLAAPERWLEPARRDALTALALEVHAARRDALAEADAAFRRVLARGPDRPSPRLDVEGWLRATDDAVTEGLSRAAHALGAKGMAPARAPDARVLEVLRARALDPLVSREGRATRLARALEPLGADARAADRLRIVGHDDATFTYRLAIAEVPRRVLLAVSGIDIGLATELDFLEGFVVALTTASASPALGLEHRAVPSEPAHATGALARLLPTERVFLEKQLGLDARTAELVRAVTGYHWLAAARMAMARWKVRAEEHPLGSDAAHALASRALGTSRVLPAGPLLGSFASSAELTLAAHAAAAAPTLFVAMRERHDEDWFRNPRARDTLEGAAARGTRLDLAGWEVELSAADRATQAASFAREVLA